MSENNNACNGSNTREKTSVDYYFDSYSHFGIHEEMLKDQVRTRAYMNAIENNKHLFKDKIVLDIGCGTGILSMFAARAGAKKVYAVECSAIAEQAKRIVHDNGFSDTIEVIQQKMEEVELPVQYVDIILSEWMGYFLLYESMLDTVLFARDKWLRPETGIMLPDKAVLYVCGIEDGQYKSDKIDFWDNVYGFNMKVIKDIALSEPLVDSVDSRAVMSNVKPILSLDICTCSKDDLTFAADFTIRANRQDYCHAFVAFFECAFTQIHKPIVFSTSPHAPYTHWKQTVFYLEEPITIKQGEDITASISCAPNPGNPRDLDIRINYTFDGAEMKIDQREQHYRLR
jgi:protein arginine N-methyltransferase 1